MDMRNVLFLLLVILFTQYIGYGDTHSSDESVEQGKRRTHNTWTSEMNAQLAEIYRNTKSDATHHFEEVKKKWYKSHPDSKLTVTALYDKYLRIFHQIEQKGKHLKRVMEWNEEKYADLVDAYLHTRPYDQHSSIELRDEWKRRHHDSPSYENKYLSQRARQWIEKRKLDVQGESSRRLFEWTYRRDSDLLHIYHVTHPEGIRRPIHVHRIFADLHPDLKDLTANQMAERIEFLQKNPTDEHFPWSEEQNEELLGIYYRTSPEIADQGQRIYDVWSKIHPRYSFMTPYYLQVHASTLAHHEETKGSNRKWRTKFTVEQRAFAIDMYRRLTKPNKKLYEFHKAWVQEYPSLAFITPKILSYDVQRWLRDDDSSSQEMAEGEQQTELRKYRRRDYKLYTSEEKAHLLATYQQADSKKRGHRDRLLKKWIDEQNDDKNITLKSLKDSIRRWIREGYVKKGKEPMLTPKTEVESGSSPSASDTSQ